MKPLYLDYMSTTPVDPRVAQKMSACLSMEGNFGNPASNTHPYGFDASFAIEKAREQLAELINAKPQELIWTSGATEAINLAIKGAAQFYQRKGKHIVTCATEHKAVLSCYKYLERQGYLVTYLSVLPNGLLDLHKLEQALRNDTVLISILHVNNEIGVIQDIESIAKLARKQGILLHVDAAQSLGKIPIDMQILGLDLMSFSGHKIYGPKGVGALYICSDPKVRVEPQMHGGQQELGLRSGTLATHQIIGMGEAAAIAKQEMFIEQERLLKLRKSLWMGIRDLPGVRLNGDEHQRVAGNLNVCFSLVEGESLLYALHELALSSGSACTSAHMEASHVLQALGLNEADSHSSLRISLGRFTTEAQVDYAIKVIRSQYLRLVEMLP